MNQAYFAAVECKYRDHLFAVAFNYFRNAADANDIVQTVWLKFYQADPVFEDEAHIKHWLIRVTMNECRRVLVSPWSKRTEPLEAYCETIAFEQPEESELFHAVLALPQKYRTVIHLYYYEDYSVREVAELLHLRETTVQTRLMRARKKLKDALQEAWQDE